MITLSRAHVPCGECHLCCTVGLVILRPEAGDDIASFDHEWKQLPQLGRRAVLKHNANGDCVYLSESGCAIHDRAPVTCRTFDCRVQFRMYSRQQRRQLVGDDVIRKEIFEAGRQRLALIAAGNAKFDA